MTEQTRTEPVETDAQGMARHTWKRRGLLAAAWAAVASIVLKTTTQVVEATGFPVQWSDSPNQQFFGMVSSPVLLGAQIDLPTSAFGDVVLQIQAGYNATSNGIQAFASGGTAILGQSFSGNAIRGQITGFTNGIGVYGLNNSAYTGPGPGAGGFGVYGLSAKGHGLVGATSTAGGAAVVGATNGVVGAYAGAFYGPVAINGAFTVFGGPKSAAVPHPDGTHRRLYCLESPESWFEDFGEGRLGCGEASITLDPDFAAVADLSKYHVFLTGYDDFELRVSERTPAGFRVKAKDNTSSGVFSWRVVAKRKDIPAPRFETVTVPHEPELPSLPQEAPLAPAPRDSRRR
jgi:hypothetical protein